MKLRLCVDANFASPYALTAFVGLTEKGLDFKIEPVDLVAKAHHKPEFAETSLTRRVPTLIHEGFSLSESSAICEYVEESFNGTRLYPSDIRARARARQIQAWMRSDLMPIRDERPTFVVFCGAGRPPLSQRAREAADTLFAAALTLLDGRTDNLFGDWSIADVDLAMMLQRLIVLGDPVPKQLIDYATRQWQRPSIQQWIQHRRPTFVDY
jgi:glutathione S-transferase